MRFELTHVDFDLTHTRFRVCRDLKGCSLGQMIGLPELLPIITEKAKVVCQPTQQSNLTQPHIALATALIEGAAEPRALRAPCHHNWRWPASRAISAASFYWGGFLAKFKVGATVTD